MDKPLAIVAVTTAVVVALLIVLFSGLVYLLPVLLALVAAVLAFLRKDMEGIVVGAVLTLAALVGIVMLVGNITFQGGASVGSVPENVQSWAAGATAGLLVVAAVAFLVRDDVEAWMPLAAGAAVLLALVLIWVGSSSIGEYSSWLNWVAALAALAAAIPAVGRLRAGD